VALVRIDVLEECIASNIRVERISKIETTLAATNNTDVQHKTTHL
jgi:hypothetical protein